MPIRYIPIDPIVLRGQAVLGNFTRSLRYHGNHKPGQRLSRGLPLYELQTTEQVRPATAKHTATAQQGLALHQQPTPADQAHSAPNLVVHGECQAACAHLLATGQKVDLVYIDPPFASGANYGKKILMRRHPGATDDTTESPALEADRWEETLYGDIWNKIERYHSDYLAGKLSQLVAKKKIQPSALTSATGQAQAAALPMGLSVDGLECIEWLSVDCVSAEGAWTSSAEAKIDAKNRLILNGVRQTTKWDGTLLCGTAPKRLRVRNVAGDEVTLVLPT